MLSQKMSFCTALSFVVMLLVGSQEAVAQSGVEEKEQSLYDRLGGLAPISVVVNDFIDALVADAFLNSNPAIDAARKRVPAAKAAAEFDVITLF